MPMMKEKWEFMAGEGKEKVIWRGNRLKWKGGKEPILKEKGETKEWDRM